MEEMLVLLMIILKKGMEKILKFYFLVILLEMIFHSVEVQF